MRQFIRVLLALLACGARVPTLAAEPAPVPVIGKAQAGDPRLDKLVTYEAKQKRLHAIAADLSLQTGVTIRTGRNERDWQVRDIPLTICVKDLNLGILLDSLTRVAHLQLSRESIRADDGKTKTIYRLWRDSKMRKAIEDYTAQKAEATLKTESWAWDTLAKVGASGAEPDKQVPKRLGYGQATPQMMRAMGRLLAALGTDVKERVLGGDLVTVTPKSLADPSLLSQLHAEAFKTQSLYGTDISYKPEEAQQVSVSFEVSRADPAVPAVHMRLEINDRTVWIGAPRDAASDAQEFYGRNVKIAPCPARYQSPQILTSGYTGFVRIDSKTLADFSPLVTKVEVAVPNEDIDLAGYLCALAHASGINFVVADYVSHTALNKKFLGGKVSPIVALAQVNKDTLGIENYHAWMIDRQHNLALAEATWWLQRHFNLVPANVVDTLTAKANGDGVMLDDIVVLTDYSYDQLHEWFTRSKSLSGLEASNFLGSCWALYAALSSEDKKRAKSPAGVPLSQVDPLVGVKIINDWEAVVSHINFGRVRRSNPVYESKRAKWESVLADPNALARLNLQVQESESHQATMRDSESIKVPPGMARSRYTLTISGSVDGEQYRKVETWLPELPVYTPKRLKEIIPMLM
ncbi:MAG: hypothetical protein WCL39_13305 [Armatimonadota bacterium]